MSWTTPQNIMESWVGDNKPTDEALLQLWIDRAERKIRREVPDITERLTVPVSDPAHELDLMGTVNDVVYDMVGRVFRNPNMVRTAQDTTGPMSGSVTYGGDHPGVLYLTAENVSDLLSTKGGKGKAFSIDTLDPQPPRHWLDHAWVNGPGDYAPEPYR